MFLLYLLVCVISNIIKIINKCPFYLFCSLGRNLVFEDEIAALQPEVDKLKTLNVNKIIALGHSGFETDKLIAQKVKGVDIVVGGHSNTFLYTGNCFKRIILARMSR